MKNRLFIVGSLCVLLLSVMGCRSDRIGVISTIPEVQPANIEKTMSVPTEEDNNSDSASPVTEIAESPEKELPDESAVPETLQMNDSEESRLAEPESPVTEELPKGPEPIVPPEADDLRQEDTIRSEVVQKEPDPPASDEPPEPTEPPAPTESPTEPQPKNAYEYPFDISVIRSDCIAIGKSMGYTLNASLTPQNATWWNPVTASENNQGATLGTSLEQYIRFHAVSNLGAYGLDEIMEFNICCEANSDGYTIYLVFA